MTKPLRVAIILGLLLLASVPSRTMAQRGPTHLVLVVTFQPGRDPAFQNVPWTDPNNRGTWYAGFIPLAKVVNGDLQKNANPVEAIRIVPVVDGDGANVRVWTMYGARYFDKELDVSTFHIGIDESVEIKELREFGVQPFTVRLARVLPSNHNLPAAVSNVPSISPLTVEPNESTLPMVTVKLRNLSYKSVVAIGVRAYAGSQLRTSALPRGLEGKDLIAPGETYDLPARIAQVAQKDGKGFIPVSAPDQRVIITSVLFRDGSFEGDVETAAHGAAYRLGERLMIESLLPIIEKAISMDESNTAVVIQWMHDQIDQLNPNVDKETTMALAAEFNGLTRDQAAGLKEIIDIGSAGLKSDFLKSMERGLESKKSEKSSDSFHALLKLIRDGLAEWHDRV